jgi:hypothetical protein
MRMTLLAAAAVIGFGLAATSGSMAAPAYGTAIKDSAATIDLTQDVWWRHWGGWHHWGHHWCYWHPRRC